MVTLETDVFTSSPLTIFLEKIKKERAEEEEEEGDRMA